jgi:hypothetical protein
VNVGERMAAEIAAQAEQAAANLSGHFSDSVRPRLARILQESAEVALRAASGQDVGTATIALDSSLRSIGREQGAILVMEGRTLALRAALTLLGTVAGV